MKTKASKSSKDENAICKKFFLIGMMGSGKSYWAEQLKRKTKLQTYDLDSLVEIMEEKSVAEIFEQNGEPYFRKAETKMLHLFTEKKQFILACGGGTPCFNNNMAWMNKQGITIWLDEPVERLEQRLSKEIDARPLVQAHSSNNTHDFIKEKLAERQPYYQLATYHLKGEEINLKNFQKIIQLHA